MLPFCMKLLEVDQTVSDFSLPNQKGEVISLFSSPHKWVVLFFYPKDMTPGCTTESRDFSKLQKDFLELDVQIWGVSADDSDSHNNFCQKENLSVSLLADVDKKVCKTFGVWQKKNMFGKESEGIVRTTFFLSIPQKKVIQVWQNVKVQEHAQEVLAFAKKNCI